MSIAVLIEPAEAVTLQLALGMLRQYTQTELAKANKAGNVLKAGAMDAMLRQIDAIRAKLSAAAS